jgi:outer membrane protein assembly factor BamB
MKKLFIILIVLVITSGCVNNNDPTLCTADVKICPDGTSVSRVAPDCEFAPCPGCSEGDIINGTCPDGGEYLKYSCDGNGEWHEVMYVRNPCEEPPIENIDVYADLNEHPWPTFHGNPKHGGVSPYDTSHVDGTMIWEFDTGGAIESSPVISKDGTIYVGSHNGYLFAINQDGTEKWRFDAGPPSYDERWNVSKSIMATPAIASDGTIYVLSSANHLFAINPDGSEKWRFYVLWGSDFWSSPTIGPDGTIYIGSARSQEVSNYDGGLIAVNPDGTEKWLFDDNSGVTSVAAIGDDGTIYFGGNVANPAGGNFGTVYALTPSGGKIWEFLIENWMESSPVIGSDGTIYIGSGREARLYALNSDGTEKWRFQASDGWSAVPAIGKDGTIYGGAWNAYFYALNPDGTERWKFKTPDAFEGVISSAAIGSDGTVYVGSNSGNFYAFDPADGTVKWNFETTGSGIVNSPAIGADGTIYFGSWNHKLYAIGGTGS